MMAETDRSRNEAANRREPDCHPDRPALPARPAEEPPRLTDAEIREGAKLGLPVSLVDVLRFRGWPSARSSCRFDSVTARSPT